MREIRSLGSVRGVPGNRHLYRDTLESSLLPESSRKVDTLERQPGWYLDLLYRSNLYAALDMAWRITRDPLVVKGLVPDHPEAKNVLQAFLDAQGLE